MSAAGSGGPGEGPGPHDASAGPRGVREHHACHLASWAPGQACGQRLGVSDCLRSSCEFEGSRKGGGRGFRGLRWPGRGQRKDLGSVTVNRDPSLRLPQDEARGAMATSAVTHLLVLKNMFPNQLPAGGQEQPWRQVAARTPTLPGSPALKPSTCVPDPAGWGTTHLDVEGGHWRWCP